MARLEAEFRAKEASLAEREGECVVRESEIAAMLRTQAATRAESEAAAQAIARIQAANVGLKAELERREQELSDREFALQAREARSGATSIADRETAVAKAESDSMRLNEASMQREAAADEREKILQELTALMREREHACNARETQLASGEAALRDASVDLLDRSTHQQQRHGPSENDDSADLAMASGLLERRVVDVARRETQCEERERATEDFLDEIRKLHASVQEREQNAAEREETLDKLGEAIERRQANLTVAEKQRGDALDAIQESLSQREREMERREAGGGGADGVGAMTTGAMTTVVASASSPPRSPNKKVNFAAVAAAAADGVNKDAGEDHAGDGEPTEKDEEIAKMAKMCEVLMMKCELLELEKRSAEEKLVQMTEVATTAAALAQKLDDAVNSQQVLITETKAERDTLRTALEDGGRVTTIANDEAGGSQTALQKALMETLVARSEALEAGFVDLEERASAAQSSSQRDRAALESALARQRLLESEARHLRAENATLASTPPPTKSRVSVRLAKELESAKAEIASLRLARIAADRKAAAAENAAKNAVARIRKSASQGAAKFGKREAERLAEKELGRARRDAERANEELAMVRITHEAELGEMARSAASERGVEAVWVKLADAARHECDENKRALADTEASLDAARREGRAMYATTFAAMAATAAANDKLDFRTAALDACAAALETAAAAAKVDGDDLDGECDFDVVADALSAPIEALGVLEELALTAAAKYVDGDVGELEARVCAAVGGVVDAARGIAAAAAALKAVNERHALRTPPPSTLTSATSPLAFDAGFDVATSPFTFDQPSSPVFVAPAEAPLIDLKSPPRSPVRATPPPAARVPPPRGGRATPPAPAVPWANDLLPRVGRRVDAVVSSPEDSLVASVERATSPAMQRLSAIEASLSSRRISMMDRIKMFDK
jgi:hypothetical protein